MARPLTKPIRLEIRLAEDTDQMLQALSAKLGAPKGVVITMAIRDMARQQGVEIAPGSAAPGDES